MTAARTSSQNDCSLLAHSSKIRETNERTNNIFCQTTFTPLYVYTNSIKCSHTGKNKIDVLKFGVEFVANLSTQKFCIFWGHGNISSLNFYGKLRKLLE